MRASVWSMAAYSASQVLRIGKNVLLAWLLFPEAFGLMALVTVVISGLEMFSDIGVGASIIRSRRGTDAAFLNTAWTMQIIRGVVLWLATCVLAVPFAWLFSRNDPLAWQLIYLLPVTGLSALLAGFRSPGLFTLNRDLRIGRLTVFELASSVTSAVVMVAWALVHPSVWALVGGMLAGAVVKVVLSYRMVPEVRVRLQWESESFRELFGFGKWIFVSTLITFLAMKADRLMLGGLVTMEVLGIYSFGVMLAMVPQEMLSRLTGQVLYPALAEQHRQRPGSLGAKVVEARSHILPAAMFMVLGVVLLAPAFFELLYDPRYHDAGWIAQLFAIGVWFWILAFTTSKALLATGRSRSLAVSNFMNFVVTVGGCMVGYWLYDLPGFILGYAAGNVAGLAVFQWSMQRAGMPVLMQDLQYTLVLAALAFVGLAATVVVVEMWPDVLAPLWWQVIAAAVLLAIFGIWTARRFVPLVLPR